LQKENDDELVRKCQLGDALAGEALVDMYWDRVFAFVYRLTINRSDAEDITQETFLRAFAGIKNYSPDGQFKSWLLRIASNLFLDLKKSARSKDVNTDKVDEYQRLQAAPEEALDRREMNEALLEAIQSLSHEQRIVVTMRAMEKLDYAEIAYILQVKEATARWQMYEARRILRHKLSKLFDLEGLSDE
jgi:RNA polymerase sigma-70 factor, ECF subfamily